MFYCHESSIGASGAIIGKVPLSRGRLCTYWEPIRTRPLRRAPKTPRTSCSMDDLSTGHSTPCRRRRRCWHPRGSCGMNRRARSRHLPGAECSWQIRATGFGPNSSWAWGVPLKL